MFFVNDDSVSTMPDGLVYIKDEQQARVLLRLRLPLTSMRPSWRLESCAELEKSAVRSLIGEWPAQYGRLPGRDYYYCKDEGKGFWWELEIFDLRPSFSGRVERLRRTWWSREFRGAKLRLTEGNHPLWVEPGVFEPDDAGAVLPARGARVAVVFDADGEVDRIWPMEHSWGSPSGPKAK